MKTVTADSNGMTAATVLQRPPVNATTGKAGRRLASAATIVGGALSFSALALSSAQFYRVSGATLGPGAFMLSIPKILSGSLAPFIGVAGAVGAACALSARRLAHSERLEGAKASTPADKRMFGGGPSLAVLAGVTAAVMSTLYTKQVVTTHADFAAAFGANWQAQIPTHLRDRLLPRRWTWRLAVAPGAHVERDVVFATIPGTDRKLLADIWSPPDGVAASGLGFIYLHGGGYSAFDKGGPTELWFRHLTAQGHVVMDVAYRLIPETNVPGMQEDVKRAIAWLKRNADRYGVNPDHIVLSGGSAGSHLALLAAYAPYHPRLTPEDVRSMDLSVRGVIGYYNAGDYRQESKVALTPTALERAVARLLTNLLGRWSGAAIAVDDTGDWNPGVFVGGRPDEATELYRQITPVVHVGPATPPTLQLVGENDVYVARSGAAAALHRKLQAAGVPSVYVVFPRTDHAFDMFLPALSPSAQTAMYHVDRFLALMAAPVERQTASLHVTEGVTQ